MSQFNELSSEEKEMMDSQVEAEAERYKQELWLSKLAAMGGTKRKASSTIDGWPCPKRQKFLKVLSLLSNIELTTTELSRIGGRSTSYGTRPRLNPDASKSSAQPE